MSGSDYRIFLIITAPLFGLLIGSFLNVCIYRLPRRETIVKGHSYCPSCHHNLAARDLIPVFSYLFLQRKCRYCRTSISGRYALIECWTGFYCFLAAWFWQSPELDTHFLPSWLQSPAAAPQWLFIYILPVTAMFAFFILLIWAMILRDRQLPPPFLYIWMLPPLVIRLILQPSRIPGHLIAFVLICFIFGLLLTLRLIPPLQPSHRLHECAGLAFIALFGGPYAARAAGLIYIISLAMLALIQGRGKYRRTLSDKMQNVSETVYLLLPAAALLTASVVWLIGK